MAEQGVLLTTLHSVGTGGSGGQTGIAAVQFRISGLEKLGSQRSSLTIPEPDPDKS